MQFSSFFPPEAVCANVVTFKRISKGKKTWWLQMRLLVETIEGGFTRVLLRRNLWHHWHLCHPIDFFNKLINIFWNFSVHQQLYIKVENVNVLTYFFPLLCLSTWFNSISSQHQRVCILLSSENRHKDFSPIFSPRPLSIKMLLNRRSRLWKSENILRV